MIKQNYIYNAIVQSVYDGDSIRVAIDLGFDTWKMNETIRLYGIDAPEIRGEERPTGLDSKAWFTSKVPVGSKIILQTIRDRKEKYGRYLGIIWFNGENINELMVSEGYAVKYQD